MPQQILNYEVIEQIGEGAGSTIYAVRDPGTKRVYAVKHVTREKPKDIRFIEQMETEFAVSKQFKHPNLRKSIELRISRSVLLRVTEAFLVMELVEGKALDVRPPSNLLDTVDTFIQASHGLRAMHALGYAHCDIKPNNIIRHDRGKVTVIDFGQAARIGSVKQRIQGTPDFIAPEQVDRKPIQAQTDVFNLGATLYWSLTGRHIPTKYTVNKKGENSFLLDTRIDTPQQLNPKIPTPLSNLVMEMIATRIQKRPTDMDQVITRLELVKHIVLKEINPDAFRLSEEDLAREASLHDSSPPPNTDLTDSRQTP